MPSPYLHDLLGAAVQAAEERRSGAYTPSKSPYRDDRTAEVARAALGLTRADVGLA